MNLATETLPAHPAVRGSDRRSPTAGNRGQGSKWLKPTTRQRIYARDEWRCVWCACAVAQLGMRGAHIASVAGTILTDGKRILQATIDHVVPRSRGGSNRPSNLITCCARCNAARGHRSVPAFAAALCATIEGDDEQLRAYRLIVRRVRAHARRKLPARLRRR
jgi:5-methylcytosine-specific restriction endonuclease McrA